MMAAGDIFVDSAERVYNPATKRYYTKKKYKGGISGLIGPGLFIFLGWLIVSGTIAWSSQLQWMLIIGGGIWWLLR